LLFPAYIILIHADFGIGDGHRRVHLAQRCDELVVFVLRLVEQDVDADRLGAESVEIGQRLRQEPAVERRTLARLDEGLVGVDHEQDALVRGDHRVAGIAAPVVERLFRLAGGRRGPLATRKGRVIPAEPCQQQRRKQQQRGQRQPTRAGLADVAPAAGEKMGRRASGHRRLVQVLPDRGGTPVPRIASEASIGKPAIPALPGTRIRLPADPAPSVGAWQASHCATVAPQFISLR
jgi:hypothetical protein